MKRIRLTESDLHKIVRRSVKRALREDAVSFDQDELPNAKYEANFNANNGTRWGSPAYGTNLRELIAYVRSTAEGERFLRNACHWYVHHLETGEEMASGGQFPDGQRYRTR